MSFLSFMTDWIDELTDKIAGWISWWISWWNSWKGYGTRDAPSPRPFGQTDASEKAWRARCICIHRLSVQKVQMNPIAVGRVRVTTISEQPHHSTRIHKPEHIPVGCVPSATVAVCWGVSAWGCLPKGVYTPRRQNSWHTLVKTLPFRNYFCRR